MEHRTAGLLELDRSADIRGKSEWVFPGSVQGWLTVHEGITLAELARGKTVLEVGSWHGRSTICMAQTAKIVHAVDWGRGDKDAGEGWQLPMLAENIRRYGLLDKVVLHVGRFKDVAKVMSPARFDFAFLDGKHDYESVSEDLCLLRCLVKSGGLIALHDWDRADVKRAALDVLGWEDDIVLVDALHCKRV